MTLGEQGRITKSDRGDRRVIDKVRGYVSTGKLNKEASDLMGEPIKLEKYRKTIRREGDEPNFGEVGAKFKPQKIRPIERLPPITDTPRPTQNIISAFFGGKKGKGSKGGSKK